MFEITQQFTSQPWLTYEAVKNKSVDELIELIKSIAYLIWDDKLIPVKELQNPGISSLIAFRMLADILHNYRADLPNEVKSFLNCIEELTKQAVERLVQQGLIAFVKPFMDHLYSYKGIFVANSYSLSNQEKIFQLIKDLPHQGQLVSRRSDNRFFLILPDFMSVCFDGFKQLKLIEPGMNKPKGEHGLSHITVNEGMTKQECEPWLQKFLAEFGETNCLYGEPHPEAYIYLNKVVPFAIRDVYQGEPKNAIQFKKVVVLRVESEQLITWDKQGLGFKPAHGREKDKETYHHHITVLEQRPIKFQPASIAHFPLTFNIVLSNLRNEGISEILKSIILSAIKASHIQVNVQSSTNFWQVEKDAGLSNVITPEEKPVRQGPTFKRD